MTKENNEEKINIISNDAVRGKPYLDIDRVINEGGSGGAARMSNDTNDIKDILKKNTIIQK